MQPLKDNKAILKPVETKIISEGKELFSFLIDGVYIEAHTQEEAEEKSKKNNL